MNTQSLFLSQFLIQIQQKPSNASEVLTKTLLLPHLQLSHTTAHIFQLALQQLKKKGAKHIIEHLHTLDIVDHYLAVEIAQLLVFHYPHSAIYLIRWYPKLIHEKSITKHAVYHPASPHVFQSIIELLISSNQPDSLDFFINKLIINSPTHLHAILRHIAPLSISFKIAPSITHLLTFHGETYINIIMQEIDTLLSIIPENYIFFQTLVKYLPRPFNIFKLYLSHHSVSHLIKYLPFVSAHILPDEYTPYFSYLDSLYMHQYIPQSILEPLLLNPLLNIEQLLLSIDSQSCYNSFIYTLSPSIVSQPNGKQLLYFVINSNFLSTCYNTEVINHVYTLLSLLDTHIKIEELKYIFLAKCVTRFIPNETSFFSSRIATIHPEIAHKVLDTIKTVPFRHIASIQCIYTLLSSVDKTYFLSYMNQYLVAQFETESEYLVSLLSMILEENIHHYNSVFIKYPHKHPLFSLISPYQKKVLYAIAYEKLPFYHKLFSILK